MLALIGAAKDFQLAVMRIEPELKQAFREAREKELSQDDLESYLLMVLNPARLLTNPLYSPSIILREAEHFEANAEYNRRSANKQKLERAQKGIPPRRKQRQGIVITPPEPQTLPFTSEETARHELAMAMHGKDPELIKRLEAQIEQEERERAQAQAQAKPEPDEEEDKENDIFPEDMESFGVGEGED
jgi:hypothetical protein